jgi:hypothetical protein
MIATDGSRSPRSSSSSSSSSTDTSSIWGLPAVEEEVEGVSTAGIVDKASLSDSTLILVAVSVPPFGILEGVVGEGGEDGIDSSGRVRRLMVTLEVGSVGSEGKRVGVDGGSVASALSWSSLRGIDSSTISESMAVSTDLLRDPPRDTLWRFREICSTTSSKGFLRLEQEGSNEIARSLGDSSIW